jgi:hypothetical protein
MEAYLRQEGRELARHLTVLTFESIASSQELPFGTYIFGAIDQLSFTERRIAEICWNALSEARPPITLLNHPRQVLCRYDLLKACFDLKRNTFRVMRASEFYRCHSFPVFIRNARRHSGSLTPLLHTPRELRHAVLKSVFKGHYLRDLIIVEYRDTVDASGIFREYNASIVGSRIIPQAVVHNSNWVTKWSHRLINPEQALEERDFMDRNPHAEWLKETFALANIQYGRIDYGVKEGVPQVWEINTNPQIVRPAEWGPGSLTPEQRILNAPNRRRFFCELQAAFETIDFRADTARTVPIHISRRQRLSLQSEKRWLHRGEQWNPRTGVVE